MLALLFVACALPTLAQGPPRDPAAVAVISKAITAMGFTAGTAPTNVQVTGSVSPAPGSEDPAGTFTSVVEVSASGYQVRNQFQYASNGMQTIFVAGAKGAAFAFGKRVINMSAHLAMITGPSQMPVFELIRAVNNSQYQVSQGAPLQIGGVSAVHVKISDETDSVTHNITPQHWYFDPNSGLPLRWEFREPDTFNAMARSVTTGAKEFSNYQTVNGMLLPMQATYFRDGQPSSITTINSAQFNVQTPGSEFDLPTGGN
jgi:hypothetical protein